MDVELRKLRPSDKELAEAVEKGQLVELFGDYTTKALRIQGLIAWFRVRSDAWLVDMS